MKGRLINEYVDGELHFCPEEHFEMYLNLHKSVTDAETDDDVDQCLGWYQEFIDEVCTPVEGNLSSFVVELPSDFIKS